MWWPRRKRARTCISWRLSFPQTNGWNGRRRATWSSWNDCILERGPEGWLRLCIGDTRLLLAPSGGDASPLEEAWRETEGWGSIPGKPPERIEGIQAEKGIWSCSPATLAREEEGLPWRRYPIQTTAEAGDIRLMTRGAGDITLPDGG